MATILMIHCNRLVSGVQYPGMSSLSAFSKRAGHNFVFFDTANYTSQNTSESYRSYKDNRFRIDLEFRHIKDKEAMPFKKPLPELLTDLKREISSRKIDMVGVSSFSDDWAFALFIIKKVRAILPSVPIVVGGVHATVNPNGVIKHPEVTAVCVGEGEEALVELLDSIDRGRIDTSIKNLWIKDAGKVIKNALRPLIKLDDDFPRLDWSLYNDTNFYYPFEGKLFRRGSVFVARGCPYSCSFCINDLFKRTYPGSSQCRFKSLEYAINELAYLKNEYRLEFLRFWDETFLAMPRKFLLDFAKAYKEKIDLPFTIETTAPTINEENAGMLADMGCQSVSIGVETSNERLRKGLLGKPISDSAYDKCFKILTECGLRKVANLMFFLPHQTLDDMWADVYACQRWKIDHPSARIFYPYVGTTLRDYCIQNDMIDLPTLNWIEDEEAVKTLDGLNENYITFQDTVLKFDPAVKEAGKKILNNFILFQETELSGHAQLSQLLDRDEESARNTLRKLEIEVYKKRFGEEPAFSN